MKRFDDNIKVHQCYLLNHGTCSVCHKPLAQGECVTGGITADGKEAVACEKCKDTLNKVIKQYVYHPREYMIPKGNKILWRYQDFTKFVSLIDSGKLFFTRADQFEDIFEGARGFNFQKEAIYAKMDTMLRLRVKSRLIASGLKDPSEGEIRKELEKEMESDILKQEERRKNYFISCWHASDRESEGMWKLYTTAVEQGVAIQTTMERLCKSLSHPDFEIGEVIYKSFEEPLDSTCIPIWYKRDAFKHENEVRVVIDNTGCKDNGMMEDVDLEMLIEKVYVSPKSPSWLANLVDHVLKKYELTASVEHSKLNEKPIY